MNCHYVLLETVAEGRKYYGIAVAADYDDALTLLDTYNDLCSDKKTVMRLINLCNELSLDPIHFEDIIEDFTTSLYS